MIAIPAQNAAEDANFGAANMTAATLNVRVVIGAGEADLPDAVLTLMNTVVWAMSGALGIGITITATLMMRNAITVMTMTGIILTIAMIAIAIPQLHALKLLTGMETARQIQKTPLREMLQMSRVRELPI
jgi:hypothetical protein